MLAEIDRRGRTEGRARPGGPPPGILRGAARGAPIECFGSFDLELRDERNVRRKILQADQSVYLYPGRARLPEGGGLVVGEHDFPDVVLEVDHTSTSPVACVQPGFYRVRLSLVSHRRWPGRSRGLLRSWSWLPRAPDLPHPSQLLFAPAHLLR